MPRRKQNEPQIFPGATAPIRASDPALDQPVFVYLTDSSEENRVRSPLAVDSMVEIRALFTNRSLTRAEELDFRNRRLVPEAISVNPGTVACTVTDPRGVRLLPDVSVQPGDIYAATVAAKFYGGYRYQFDGRDGWSGSNTRVFEIK